MFATELKFAFDCLIIWFNAKYKSKNIVISNDLRRKYEIEHPIDYSKNHCCICTFPIEINPTMYDATKDQMSYADFNIFKEHKFLRNIFAEKELSNSINTIKEFDACPNEELQDFISEFCQDCVDFAEINEKIIEVEMKNTYRTKTAKKTLQIYAFVYQRIMDFPHNKFDYETVTTNDLFVYIHKKSTSKFTFTIHT